MLACLIADDSEEYQQRRQSLLAVDQDILGDTLGHRLRGHGDDGADEVVARVLLFAEFRKVLPKRGPLRRLPAIRPLEQWDDILPILSMIAWILVSPACMG